MKAPPPVARKCSKRKSCSSSTDGGVEEDAPPARCRGGCCRRPACGPDTAVWRTFLTSQTAVARRDGRRWKPASSCSPLRVRGVRRRRWHIDASPRPQCRPTRPFLLERTSASTSSPPRCSSPAPMSRVSRCAIARDEPAAEAMRCGMTVVGLHRVAGHPLLLREIAATCPNIDLSHILEIAPEEGIFIAMSAIVAAGDNVVVTWPAYQSLRGRAGAARRFESGMRSTAAALILTTWTRRSPRAAAASSSSS